MNIYITMVTGLWLWTWSVKILIFFGIFNLNFYLLLPNIYKHWSFGCYSERTVLWKVLFCLQKRDMLMLLGRNVSLNLNHSLHVMLNSYELSGCSLSEDEYQCSPVGPRLCEIIILLSRRACNFFWTRYKLSVVTIPLVKSLSWTFGTTFSMF